MKLIKSLEIVVNTMIALVVTIFESLSRVLSKKNSALGTPNEHPKISFLMGCHVQALFPVAISLMGFCQMMG